MRLGTGVHGIALLTVSALSILAAVPAAATTLVRMSVEDMTSLASDVVVGRVADVRSEYTADGAQIVTYVTLEEAEPLKGEAGRRLTFVQWGGQVGDDALTVIGAPVFGFGEEVVVFLTAMASEAGLGITTDRWLLGLGQGKWSVTRDGAGRPVAVNAAAERLVGPEGDRGDLSLPLDDLRRRVRDAALHLNLHDLGGN